MTKKNNWNYFKETIAFIFLLFLPTQLGKHFFFSFSYLSGIRVDYLAPTIYFIDIIFLLLVLINYTTIVAQISNKKFWLFLGVLFVNCLFAKNRWLAIYQNVRLIEVVMIFFVFSKKIIKEKKMLLALSLAAGAELFLCLLQFVYKHSLQGVFYFFGERLLSLSTPGIAKASLTGIEILRPYGTFSHPNSLAGFYLLLFTFVLTNRRFNKYLIPKAIFLFLSSLLVFFSFSKIAIILYVLINAVFIFKEPLKKLCRPCVIGRLLVFSLLALVFLQAKADPLSLKKRLVLSKNSLEIIGKSPFFGTGAGSYLLAQNYFSRPFFDLINQPVHNIFLLFFSEYGLILSLALLVLLWPLIIKLWQKNPYVFMIVVASGMFDHYWLTLIQNLLLLGVIFGSL